MKTPAPVVLLGVVLVLGCSGDGQHGAGEPHEGPSATLAPDTIAVTLGEYWIDMPRVLPAGRVILLVRNEGIEEHDLYLSRLGADSVWWRLPKRLSPGEETTAVLDIPAADYDVICDFAGHHTRGMFVRVAVRASEVR